jgi:hypothetical protein
VRVRASHHILSLHVLATVIEKKDCDYETVKPYLKIIKGGVVRRRSERFIRATAHRVGPSWATWTTGS